MAQWLSWLERRPVTAEVTGSSPVWVVYKWDLSSAGRASALQAEGHRFEPYRSHKFFSMKEGDVGPSFLHMARWLNWLERPVHTREVKSSSLFLAT